jgi:hypothetical protein
MSFPRLNILTIFRKFASSADFNATKHLYNMKNVVIEGVAEREEPT